MVYRFRIRLVDGIYFPDGAEVERVMDVPGTFTVEDLVKEILDSIEFDFDHLYSLYVKGKEYAGAPCSAPAKERCRVKLQTLALSKGDLMTLVYDYGDEWQFEIAVMQISSEKAFGAKLIETRGHVEQYPEVDESGAIVGEAEDDSVQVEWTYTMPEELMDAAFAYKKTKIWKRLWSSDIFAIRFSDGEIGYISIMGNEGEHCALAIYCGEAGFESLWRISFYPGGPLYEQREMIMRQECVQLIFDNKEYLFDVEVAAVKEYGAEHGIRFAGKNAFPHVRRFRPYQMSWYPEAKDEQHLLEALDALSAFSEVLKTKLVPELGIKPFQEKAQDLLLVEKKGGAWTFDGKIHVEPPKPESYITVDTFDEELIRKVRKRKKQGRFACKLFMLPQYVGSGGEDCVLPLMLVTLDQDSDYVVSSVIRSNYETDMPDMVHEWLQQMQENQLHPARIVVTDARTYALLSGVAAQLGSTIRQVKELPELESLIRDIMRDITGDDDMYEDDMGDEDIYSLVYAVLGMTDKALRTLPENVVQGLTSLIDLHILPPDIEEALEEKLKVLKRR